MELYINLPKEIKKQWFLNTCIDGNEEKIYESANMIITHQELNHIKKDDFFNIDEMANIYMNYLQQKYNYLKSNS